jgi:curved DNA-binding protein CbpA
MSSSKDYYDILGVRPTAKLAEIELAFRGRRTQYHPDKYATADADTVRWATEKMQEVNEAYGILGKSDARARYDQERQYANANTHSSQRPNHSDKATANEQDIGNAPFILDYLMALPLDQKDAKRFHFAPDIPRQKLSNALACRSYYATKPPSQAYLLVDDTLFDGGADGLLITDKVISFKEMFASSNDYLYTKGWNGKFSLQGSTIRRHDRICKTFSLISASAVQMLAWALNQFFADRFDWHVKRALCGHVDSQFILSASCQENPEEELRWLTLAAENGHVTAQHNLGMHYSYKNPPLAFQWFTKAAQQGSTNAEKNLRADIFKQFH